MLKKIYSNLGIVCRFANLSDPNSIKAQISTATRMVWAETPSNPLLNITDLSALSAVCHQHQLLLVVDNTFATPYFQNPLDLGADIIIHSATKYLGGHSDALLGGVITSDKMIDKKLRFIQNSCGAVPGPLDCYLVMRGIKTLHLRMLQHAANAKKVAHFLRKNPAISEVYWPGFEDHPSYKIATDQMRGYGGVVSFKLKNAGRDVALKLLSLTTVFLPAEGLGGVESLINHPATMSHGSLPHGLKQKIGISENLIRLSVGIEEGEDLINDLSMTLKKLSNNQKLASLSRKSG